MQYGGMSQGYPTAPSYMYAPSGPQNPGLYAQPSGVAPYQLTRPQNSRFGSTREIPVTNPYASPPGALMPIPGESHGRRSRQRPANHRSESDPAKRPLKSAMKKPKRSEHVLPNGGPHRSQTMPVMEEIGRLRSRLSEVGHDDELVRTRTISDPNRGRANQFSRPRARSQAEHHYTPSHIFVGFGGSNTLNMGSVNRQATVDLIRERVLAIWPEGLVFQRYTNETNEYRAQFVGNPWTTKGPSRLLAMKMILELFAVLYRQGYSCTSAIDMGHPTRIPRLVFTARQPDLDPDFFILTFSSGRRKMETVNLPEPLCLTLAEALRQAFNRNLTSAVLDQNEMYKLELSREFDQSSDLVAAVILEHMITEGFRLEATIPLSHSGLWSLIQGRKEVWVFRRISRSFAVNV